MGRNNKARRAAKQRKRARQSKGSRAPGQGRPQPNPFEASPGQQQANPFEAGPGFGPGAAYGVVELEVVRHVNALAGRKSDDAAALRRAEAVLRHLRPASPELLHTVVADLLARLVGGTIDGGWGPADLRELIGRGAGGAHLATLNAVLADDARRSSRGHAWQQALDAMGPASRLRVAGAEALASCLMVAALLASAPTLEASDLASARTTDAESADHPKLAQVRALLAKAESTDYDEEAEALSAKAQQLIAKYALGRLLDQQGPSEAGSGPQVRRLWLDAPYVDAKAALVHEVDDANRSRSASAERFGFCVLVGSSANLDLVELLVTSLLVQADAAMLRHGRRVAAGGRSRTRSFRRSFLMAYAVRVGQRLRDVTAEAVAAEFDGRLLPVLRDHEATVTAAFEQMMPALHKKETTISNPEGWMAGEAAADLAQLDVNGKITERAG